MRIGNFEHQPSAQITIIYALFAAALLSLGTWQMYRAAEKTTILAAAEQSLGSDAIAIETLGDLHVAAIDHTRVTFTGLYEGTRQFLWDNRVHNGQAGFEVITPVRTESGLVLVNRGWVAPGRTRDDLPDVSLSDAVLQEPITFTGLFSRPSKGLISGQTFDPAGDWPRTLQYFDYDAIAQAFGVPVLAGVVQPQQKSAAASGVIAEAEREPNNERDEFFTANWEPTAAIGPARHYGYAFQWYAMAAALTILFIVYNTKRIKPVHEHT